MNLEFCTKRNYNLRRKVRDFPGGPVVKTLPSMQGVQIQSLVGELRSYMPWGQKTKTKQKQYCNKFNKDFKNGLHQKKNLKKNKSEGETRII